MAKKSNKNWNSNANFYTIFFLIDAGLSPTRLPSNLRHDHLQRVHLVTSSYFWSCNKDAGHIIRSAAAKSPTLQAQFTAECYCLRVIQDKIFILRGSGFVLAQRFPLPEYWMVIDLFLLLWPWPRPDDLHIRTWPVFPGDTSFVLIWTSYIKAFTWQTESNEIINQTTSWVVKKQTVIENWNIMKHLTEKVNK